MPGTTRSSQPGPARPRRERGPWWKVLLVLGLVVGLLAGVGIYVLNKVSHLPVFNPAGCTASSSDGSVSLDLDQARYASTIAAVGVKLEVPDFGIEIAEATAMQESKLHDLAFGDRDSVGLFQQRPSQGWGTQTQIMDPVYAATRFYEALLKVDGWQSMTLTQAAQAVQRSGAPDAYAKHEGDAKVVAAVFTGASPAGLGCTLDGPTFAAQVKGSALLTARGQAVVDELRAQFGTSDVGRVSGFGADGLSFDVSVPAGLSGTAVAQRAWAFADWAAAQAETSGISQVSYGGRVWSATQGSDGWRTGEAGSPGSVHIVMSAGG